MIDYLRSLNLEQWLWFAVAACALAFAGSGYWQTFNPHARKPALASGSPLRFAIAMTAIALLCIARGVWLSYLWLAGT